MYWIIYFIVLALLVISSIVLSKRENDWYALTGICASYLGLSGLFVGFTMPELHIVKEDDSIEVHQYCIPRYYTLNDGTRFFLHTGNTYIVNEHRKRLCLATIQYVNNKDYVGTTPAYTYRDTVDSKVMQFKTKDVSPFVEAPSSIEEDCSGGVAIRKIIEISLERQHFAPKDGRYHPITEPKVDYTMNYANL